MARRRSAAQDCGVGEGQWIRKVGAFGIQCTNGSSVMHSVRPEHLLRLARDKSARGREELSEAVSDLFVGESEARSDKERALMEAILHQLIRDAESSVRRLR